MYILHCVKCGTEYGFPDDHPYFTHDEARTDVGEHVIFEAFKPRAEIKKCKACGAPITQIQALKTYNEQGRALCEGCSA